MTFPIKSKIFIYFIGLMGTIFLLWAKDEPCFKKPSDCPVFRFHTDDNTENNVVSQTEYTESSMQPFEPASKGVPRENRSQCHELSRSDEASLFPPSIDKFILSTEEGSCGRIGNQIYRFASIYGIGKPVGRMPALFLNVFEGCQKENDGETTRTFPVYARNLKKISYSDHLDMAKIRNFTQNANKFCVFDDPARYNFASIKNKYLVLGQHKMNYFQNYKYFHRYRHEIRQIFTFNREICTKIEAYAEILFGSNWNMKDEHRFCIHTRRGDFKNYGFESNKDFTEAAAKTILKILNKNHQNISLLLLGEDKDFLYTLDFSNLPISRRLIPKEMSAGEDFAFATMFCDSLLITAPESTYSFFIAYFMPDDSQIFYNSHMALCYDDDKFPREWVGLKLMTTDDGGLSVIVA